MAGIMSGTEVDAHKEAMSVECIKGFEEQANEKDITLIVHHNDDFTGDIGILDSHTTDGTGQWNGVFRLYDDYDKELGIPQADIERANKVWMMKNGMAPYKTPREFGFSIQGVLDPQTDLQKSPDGGTIIKRMELDCVGLVLRPAYSKSQVESFIKSLFAKSGKADLFTIVTKTILDDKLQKEDDRREFYDEKYRIESAFSDVVNDVLGSDLSPEDKAAKINEAFEGYRAHCLNLFSSFGFKFPDDDEENIMKTETKKKEEVKPEDTAAPETTPPVDEKKEEGGDTAAAIAELASKMDMILQALQGMAPAQAPVASSADTKPAKKTTEGAGSVDDAERDQAATTDVVTEPEEVAKAQAMLKRHGYDVKIEKRKSLVQEINDLQARLKVAEDTNELILKGLNVPENIAKMIKSGEAKQIEEPKGQQQVAKGSGVQVGGETQLEAIAKMVAKINGEVEKSEVGQFGAFENPHLRRKASKSPLTLSDFLSASGESGYKAKANLLGAWAAQMN